MEFVGLYGDVLKICFVVLLVDGKVNEVLIKFVVEILGLLKVVVNLKSG